MSDRCKGGHWTVAMLRSSPSCRGMRDWLMRRKCLGYVSFLVYIHTAILLCRKEM